uniref:Nose resistant to fluoxetine protein 6 n=1 Tax=Cacopsylla melanoneura TaxID=428564 RepID=A0A8D8VUV6_9HEMI
MILTVIYCCVYATVIVPAFVANGLEVDLPSSPTVGLTSDQQFESELGKELVPEIKQKDGQTRSIPVFPTSAGKTIGNITRDGLEIRQTLDLTNGQKKNGQPRTSQDGSSNVQKVSARKISQFRQSSGQQLGLDSTQQDGLPSQWLSKIFSDAMWNFVPHSKSKSKCNLQARLYQQHLSNNTHWAIRMLDASLIVPSGIIAGAGQQFGHPDQCIHTRVPLPDFRTKYCLPSAQFSPYKDLYTDFYNKRTQDWPPYDMKKNVWDFLRPRDQLIRFTRHSFSWGLCIPESCSAEDIQTSLNDTLSRAFAKHQIHIQVNLTELQCYSVSEEKVRQMPLAGYLWTCVWYALIVLSFLGTVVHYQLKNEDNQHEEKRNSQNHTKEMEPSKLKQELDSENCKLPVGSSLLPFSFHRNAHNLVSKDNKKNVTQIDGIDGLKGLAITGTLVFHREMNGFSYAKNLEYVEWSLRSVNFAWITASMNILDTFFFISGFLLAKTFIQNLNKHKTPNFFSLIVNRLFRIYPMYLMIIGFTIWVQPYIGEGPLWKSYADTEAQVCRKYWWQNLLFISTLYTEGNDICIPSSWYLSTDFQLYLISLALIFIVTKCPTWRKHILIFMFVVAHLVPSIVIYLEEEPSMWILSVKGLRANARARYLRNVYCPFYMRMGPHIYGVCAAYLTDYLVKRNFKFSTLQKTTICLITFGSTIGMFYAVAFLFLVPERIFQATIWEHVVFVIPYKLVYCSTVAIGIIIEHCGGYGAVSDFFCHPIWVTLGRMSYHMYLWNFLIISWDVFLAQSLTHYNLYVFMLRAIGDIGMVSLISFFSHNLLEPPVAEFRKKFLPK